MKESGCDAVSKKQTGDAKDGAQGKGEAHSHSQVGFFPAIFGGRTFGDKTGDSGVDAGVGKGYSYCQEGHCQSVKSEFLCTDGA